MPVQPVKWNVAPPLARKALAGYKHFDPVLAQVLYNRGFTDPLVAERFLYTRTTADPLDRRRTMKGLDEAVARLKLAIKQRERIIVYGDFDADGVTSTALMVQVLRALDAVVEPYIPHRIDEGYGLNSETLHALMTDGARVVMTVDCGIRSIKEVEDGLAYGLDMIVTDHHTIGPDLPQIDPKRGAVINPKQPDCKFPEDMLAGVGVAYKLAGALARTVKPEEARQIMAGVLDLVAIGTVADLAPLDRPENRALVRHGLARINSAPRPGIAALMEVAGVKPGTVTAMTIGFALGPRINAAGRLDSAMLAYDLLMSEKPDEATGMAAHLQQLNIERQHLTRAAQSIIREQVLALDAPDIPLIFAEGEFQPGIVGLVAGRLVEEFYRPAVVMEKGETESRASCRSIPQFDITAALDQCAELLVRHGGHAQAAGFTVANENIPVLRERLTQIARDALIDRDLSRILEIDAEIDPRHINEALYESLQHLEPTGHANPAPVLASCRVRVKDARTVGKEGQHLKLRLQPRGGPVLDAIAFGFGELADGLSSYIDLAYNLEMNEWNGTRSLQLNVLDIKTTNGHY